MSIPVAISNGFRDLPNKRVHGRPSTRNALTFICQMICSGESCHVFLTRRPLHHRTSRRPNINLRARNVELRGTKGIPHVKMLDAQEVLSRRSRCWNGKVHACLISRRPPCVVKSSKVGNLEPIASPVVVSNVMLRGSGEVCLSGAVVVDDMGFQRL